MNKISILLLTAAIILISCNEQDQDKILAELKTGDITVGEFENAMLENSFQGDYNQAAGSSMDQRRDFVKEMAFRDIVYDLSEKNSLDTFKTVREEFENKLYAYAILQGLIVDSIRKKIYDEADMKNFYEKKKVKFFPKHILVDSKKHGDESARHKIDSIYTLVEKGEKFEELAKEHSDDIRTGVNGGELGWVFSYDMVKEFEDQILKMEKGEVSKPFKTEYGFHIVLLADKKKNDKLTDFENDKYALMRDMDNKHASEFNELYLDLIEGLFDRYNVSIDSSNIDFFLQKYRSMHKEEGAGGKDPLEEFTKEELDRVLVFFNGQNINISTLTEQIRPLPVKDRPELDFDEINKFIIGRYRHQMLQKYADELGYTKKEKFIDAAKKDIYSQLKEKVLDHFVRSKIKLPDEEELKEIYEKNKNKYRNDDGTYKDFKKVKVSILNSIKSDSSSKKLKTWKKEILEEYGFKIDHLALEETFYMPGDDKK
ncbi:MAG: peptidylprolyl isomerase [Candidatus Delongbacteria bacterium]